MPSSGRRTIREFDRRTRNCDGADLCWRSCFARRMLPQDQAMYRACAVLVGLTAGSVSMAWLETSPRGGPED